MQHASASNTGPGADTIPSNADLAALQAVQVQHASASNAGPGANTIPSNADHVARVTQAAPSAAKLTSAGSGQAGSADSGALAVTHVAHGRSKMTNTGSGQAGSADSGAFAVTRVAHGRSPSGSGFEDAAFLDINTLAVQGDCAGEPHLSAAWPVVDHGVIATSGDGLSASCSAHQVCLGCMYCMSRERMSWNDIGMSWNDGYATIHTQFI